MRCPLRQSNVTSLPVLGGDLGDGTVYVTVAVPDGASLTNVYTIDPADETQVATPPPAGVSLPEGLTKFIVEGVEVGSSQTISIHTSSTAGLAGYAKYDVSAGEWSLLPSERVVIHPDRVDITLTDGGVGDADGVANGVIDDPGALVVITDVTAPAVSITGLVDGATYQFGEVPAVGCDAVDDMSGLAGECELSGYEAAPGCWTVTATATDLVGNVGSAAATYTVEPWELQGFHAPVKPGVVNTVKAGATVPLKFEVVSGSTELRDVPVIGADFTVRPMLCGTSTVEDPVDFTTTGTTSLRYDEDGGAFIQNWKTPSLPGCYLVTVETGDGSSLSAEFKLK